MPTRRFCGVWPHLFAHGVRNLLHGGSHTKGMGLGIVPHFIPWVCCRWLLIFPNRESTIWWIPTRTRDYFCFLERSWTNPRCRLLLHVLGAAQFISLCSLVAKKPWTLFQIRWMFSCLLWWSPTQDNLQDGWLSNAYLYICITIFFSLYIKSYVCM